MTGKEIKELRKRLAYTQARLAEEIGVTSATVARYERDDFKPSPPVTKLLKLLEIMKTAERVNTEDAAVATERKAA